MFFSGKIVLLCVLSDKALYLQWTCLKIIFN